MENKKEQLKGTVNFGEKSMKQISKDAFWAEDWVWECPQCGHENFCGVSIIPSEVECEECRSNFMVIDENGEEIDNG